VVDGPGPVGEGQGAALVVADRDQRELGPALVDGGQVLQVQAAVQGGQGAVGAVAKERELHHVGVEVDDVELVGQGPDLGDLAQVSGEIGFQGRGIKPDGLVANGDQLGLGLGFGAGEQGDVVTEIDERVGQVGDDTLRAAIQTWRNGADL
jgi:hypothetical protein